MNTRSTRLAGLLRALTGSPRRIFLTSFAVFFALSTAFAVAMPMGSAPDDQTQMIKAAATARGEINGVKGFQEQFLAQGATEQPVRYYNVPVAYANINSYCYAGHITKSAGCAKPIAGGDQTVSLPSTAGQYNPIYYALVGWPSVFFTGSDGMYLMRVMSALLCSLFLAGAMVTAAQWRRRAFAVLGVTLAATPMVLFLNGAVNPNSIEASSAVMSWTLALSITMDPRPDLLKRRLIWLAVALAALANARPLGAEWVAAVVVVALFVQQRGVFKDLFSRRLTWLLTGLTAVAVLFGVGWSATHGDNAKVPYIPANAFVPAAHATFSLSNWYIESMIGYFGWLDTPSPELTYYIWVGTVIALLVFAWACSRLRESFAMFAILIGIIAIPVLSEGLEAKNIGQVWQGRYLLAFAVGLPVLIGLSLAKNGVSLPDWLQSRLTTIFAVLLAIANFAAFFRSFRRYAFGVNGALVPSHVGWEPPGTWALWLPFYVIVLVVQILVVHGLSRGRGGELGEVTGSDAGSGADAGSVAQSGSGSGSDADAESASGARLTGSAQDDDSAPIDPSEQPTLA